MNEIPTEQELEAEILGRGWRMGVTGVDEGEMVFQVSNAEREVIGTGSSLLEAYNVAMKTVALGEESRES